MKLIHVVGARPNFMKVAPVIYALRRERKFYQLLVHTGQHYDVNMSEIFFRQLGIRQPDVNLGVGSGTAARQTAEIMMRFESVLLDKKPDRVVVYGDVHSTLAAALTAVKLGIQVAHVEAGLRSWDRRMPEEINRLLTDRISDVLFTPSIDADENLLKEGVPREKIHRVGNVMIDSLVRMLPKARPPRIRGIEGEFLLATLHRPSNVDDGPTLKKIVQALLELSRHVQIVFPVHPRTRKKMADFGIDPGSNGRFLCAGPLGYLEFLALERDAMCVVTDSGGVQEETTYLGVPCITVRENTERPVTLTEGTNRLAGTDVKKIKEYALEALHGKNRTAKIPPLWDGRAGERIARVFKRQAGLA